MSATDDATLAGVTAAALNRGRAMDAWSLALLIAALGILLWMPGDRTSWSFALLLACVFSSVAQRIFAARVAFDAALFKRWAEPAAFDADRLEPLAALDRALAALGLRKRNGGPPRDLASRSRGALRLMGWQAFCLFMQLAALLAAVAC